MDGEDVLPPPRALAKTQKNMFGASLSRNHAERVSCKITRSVVQALAGKAPASLRSAKVDSWCLGWSTFYLLVAQPMFHSADPTVHDADWTLFQRRVFSKLFQQKGWRATLSHQAKDFILRLMQINPDLRMSLKQALRHPWLTEDVAQQHVFDRDESKQAFDADRLALERSRGLSGHWAACLHPCSGGSICLRFHLRHA